MKNNDFDEYRLINKYKQLLTNNLHALDRHQSFAKKVF